MPDYIADSLAGDNRYVFYLVKVIVQDEPKIQLAVVDRSKNVPEKDKIETLVLTASIKPYINLVWSGTIVLVIGFFLSILKRRKNLSR